MTRVRRMGIRRVRRMGMRRAGGGVIQEGLEQLGDAGCVHGE
jgi:hypothetical protein